jgi:hypothetical protein
MFKSVEKPKPIRIFQNKKLKLYHKPPKLSMKEIFGVKSPKKIKIKKKKNNIKNSHKYK